MPWPKIFHRAEAQQDYTTEEILAQTLLATKHVPSPAEIERLRDKGIDIDMILAQEIIEMLTPLCYDQEKEIEEWRLEDQIATKPDGTPLYETVPATDANGNVLYEDAEVTQKDGTVLIAKKAIMTQKPVMLKKMVKITRKISIKGRAWLIAALGYLNKVWPTIWMSSFSADTTKLMLRTAFHEIRKTMPLTDKAAFSVVLNMIRDLCIARCEDMKEGHKALLLKVMRQELGVRLDKSKLQPGVK